MLRSQGGGLPAISLDMPNDGPDPVRGMILSGVQGIFIY